MTSQAQDKVSGSAVRSVLAAAVGNAIEWFDFALYGYFAPIIATLFFPGEDKVASYLATFGVFAVGFLVRPIGGAIFGNFGDRFGRRALLLFSVVAMSLPTMALGLLPTFATIGIFAPILLVLVRILQGLAVGGEFSGSISYLAEYAPSNRRGLFGSWSMTSCFSGILLGSAAAALVSTVLTQEQLYDWGWRLPFIAAAGLGTVAFFVRRAMRESPAFEAAKEQGKLIERPVYTALRTQWRNILLVVGMLWLNAVSQYYFFVFFTTYVHHFGGLPLDTALQINTISMVVVTALLPVFGYLSDIFGRRPVLIAGGVGFILFSMPLMSMMTSGDYLTVVTAQICYCIFLAARSGPVSATMCEVFPTNIRYSALAIAYNVNFAIFGGTAPFIATSMIDGTGNTLSPAWYLMAAAVVSVFVSYKMKETRGKTIEG